MCNVISGLRAVKEVVVIVAAATGAFVAVLGLRTWRKQIRGQHEYELAKRLLHATYSVRNTMDSFRSVFTAKTPDDWQRVEKAWSDLLTARLEAEVLWGAKSTEVIRPLIDCLLELASSIRRKLRDEKAGDKCTRGEEERDQIEEILSADESGDDPFTKRLRAAIVGIEDFLKQYL